MDVLEKFEVGNVYRKGPNAYLVLDDGEQTYLLTYVKKQKYTIAASDVEVTDFKRIRSISVIRLAKFWRITVAELDRVAEELLLQYRYREAAMQRCLDLNDDNLWFSLF